MTKFTVNTVNAGQCQSSKVFKEKALQDLQKKFEANCEGQVEQKFYATGKTLKWSRTIMPVSKFYRPKIVNTRRPSANIECQTTSGNKH